MQKLVHRKCHRKYDKNKVLQKTGHGKCYRKQDMNKILQKMEYKENAVENRPVQKAIEKRT